jgi:RHS repeat-associated protein
MKTAARLLVLLSLFTSAAFAQKVPNIELGFNANRIYQLGDVDHVNLFNGNLIVTLPIGQPYKVNGNIGYAFKLVYNSNAWDYRVTSGRLAGDPAEYTESVPNLRSNAGMGWRLTTPRIIAPYEPTSTTNTNPAYPGVRNGWCYEDESGAEHAFTPNAYNNAAPTGGWTLTNTESAVVQFTTDGSNLRMIRSSSTARMIQFPDGTTKKFSKHQSAWRLDELSDGWGNWVRFAYVFVPNSQERQASKVTITESSGARTQVIDFVLNSRLTDEIDGGMQVQKVTLSAFNATTAVYTFNYTDTLVPQGCNATAAATTTVPMLTSVDLPDQRHYTFDYHTTSSACEQGALKTLTLPTLGSIAYTYTTIKLPNFEDFCSVDVPISNVAGVRSRTVGNDRWEYIQTQGDPMAPHYAGTEPACYWADEGFPHSHLQPVIRWSRMSVVAPARPGVDSSGAARTIRSRSDYYFNTFAGPSQTLAHWALPPDTPTTLNYAWPITGGYWDSVAAAAAPGASSTHDDTDVSAFDVASNNRYVSEVQYDDCTSTGDCRGTQLDASGNPVLDSNNQPIRTDGNRLRTVYRGYEMHGAVARGLTESLNSEKTVYEDDKTCAHGATCWSVADYSNFDGITHYQSTNYSGNFATGGNSSGAATYYDTVAHTDANMLDPTKPWLIDNYTGQTRTENGVTAANFVCFDPRGNITRTRTLKNTYAFDQQPATDRADLLNVYDYDTQGNMVTEHYYGGDLNLLPDTAIDCQTSLGAVTADYQIQHAWQYGTPNLTRYLNATGSPLTFNATDYDVDAATGLVKTSRDSAGITTTYGYDAMGRVISVTPTGTLATSYVYSSSGAPRVDISQGTLLSNVTFDPFGRISTETRSMALNPNEGNVSRTTTYDSLGRTYQLFDWGSSAHSTSLYDSFGRPVVLTAPDNAQTTLAYTGVTEMRRTVSIQGPTAAQASTTVERYDRQGRLISVREPSDLADADVTTLYGYDIGNRLSSVRTAVGSVVQQRTFAYDARGFLASEQHPEKGSAGNGVTRYESYDARGHAGRRYEDGGGTQFDLRYVYDAAERLLKVTETDPNSPSGQPAQRDLKVFTFATANSPAGCGTPSSTCDARNGKLLSAVRHNYDPTLGDVAVTSSYHYTGLGGRLAQFDSDAAQTSSFIGRSFKVSQSFNTFGLPATLTYPTCISTCGATGTIGTIALGYTSAMLTSVGTYASQITYAPSGTIATVTHAGALTETWTADASGMARPATISATTPAGVNWSTGAYTYDAAGNIATIGTKSYGYDKVNRLVAMKDTVPGVTLPATTGYTYDAFGNQTARTSTFMTGDAVIKTKATIAVDAATNHLSGVTYDAAGNQASWSTAYDETGQLATSTASWDAVGNMHSLVSSSRLGTTYYIYDADDERLATVDRSALSQTNSTRWTLRGFGHELLRTYNDDPTTGWSWVDDNAFRGSQLLANESPTGTKHYALDHLGSPRVVVGANGALIGYQQFQPFGEGGTTGTGSLQFTAHERDRNAGGSSETLDYMHARWYSAGAGRFLSVDPATFWQVNGERSSAQKLNKELQRPQVWNRYSYVENSPVKALDTNGKETFIITTFDYGIGSHSAVIVERNGDSVLFDPAGSYVPSSVIKDGGQRGSGDSFYGEEASLKNYVEYQKSTGSEVKVLKFNTTAQQEKVIKERIEQQPGIAPGSCALATSTVISGVGPFSKIEPMQWPGRLFAKLREALVVNHD